MVVLVGILGLAAGLALQGPSSKSYESKSVLLIEPPSSALAGQVFNNDPDRYVISQLSVLRSVTLSERVASQFSGETTKRISKAVKITQTPKTAVVNVVATEPDPEHARQIADAYVTLYIDDLRTRANSAQAPELADLNKRLAVLKVNLESAQLKVSASEAVARLTPGASVDAVATADRDTTLREYERLLDTRSQLELVAKLKVNTDIVQPATLATAPVARLGKLIALVGLFAGLILGLVLATITARFSPNVIDPSQIEDSIGQPIAGRLGRLRGLATLRERLLGPLPSVEENSIEQLCVRAEANAKSAQALQIAVVGTQRGSGSTTLATAIAGRFARTGMSVILVDADQNTHEISRSFDTGKDAGLPTLLAGATGDSATKGAGRSGRNASGSRETYTSTESANVKILGLGPKPDVPSLRRTQVQELMEAVAKDAQVIIFDGGPLLDSASTAMLAQNADAVVLAVAQRHQALSALDAVSRQLRTREGELLPVVVASRSRSSLPSWFSVRGTKQANNGTEGDDGEPKVIETETVVRESANAS